MEEKFVIPIKLKKVSNKEEDGVMDGIAFNISYNGIYVRGIDIKNMKVRDKLHISLLVPKEHREDFPFSRIAGRVEVARILKGVIALKFTKDTSYLLAAY